MRLSTALLLGLLPAVEIALAFSSPAALQRWAESSSRWGILPRQSSNDDNADDDNDNEDDEDWRTFRAKLVMSEGGSSSISNNPSSIDNGGASTTAAGAVVDGEDLDGFGALFSSSSTSAGGFTPLSPSQWAYDSGKIIEKGAVILGGVEQDFGFGLRQQYFHKSVILVLDHDDKFTKGIILNRPSDRLLDDDLNSGLQWRVVVVVIVVDTVIVDEAMPPSTSSPKSNFIQPLLHHLQY